MRLADTEDLVGGVLDGGRGFVWHRGGGGCGLMADFKGCRASAEAFCPAGSLGKMNQIKS